MTPEAEPVKNKFAALPERTLPDDYVQEVDVDRIDYVGIAMDDWLKKAVG